MTGISVMAVMLLAFGMFAALITVAIVAAVNSSRRAKERTAALAAYSNHREWTFLPSQPDLVNRFSGPPFDAGSGRRATNVIHGRHAGRPFTAFDHHHTTTSGSGEDRRTHHHVHSVIALSLGVSVPPLSVAPQGGIGRFFGKVFGTDLLIGDPTFDDAFHISVHSPEFARDVLHPDMTRLLLQWPDLAWRTDRDSLLLIRSGHREPPEIEWGLAAMEQIIAQIPPHVWSRLRGQG